MAGTINYGQVNQVAIREEPWEIPGNHITGFIIDKAFGKKFLDLADAWQDTALYPFRIIDTILDFAVLYLDLFFDALGFCYIMSNNKDCFQFPLIVFR